MRTITHKIINGYRICTKCEQNKPISEYGIDSQKADGLCPSCKECRQKYYQDNHEYLLQKRRDYVDKNRERVNEGKREYYKNNQPKIRRQAKEFYKNHKEEINAKNAKWRKESVKGQFMTCRRGAEIRNLDFLISLDEFEKTIRKPCNYCGTVEERRGIDRIDSNIGYLSNNIVPCCYPCNWMKNDLTVNEFLSHCQKIIDHQKTKSC